MEKTLAQSYFNEGEVSRFSDELISLCIRNGMAPNTKAAATMALNVVRIMEDRLDMSPNTSGWVYQDQRKALGRVF